VTADEKLYKYLLCNLNSSNNQIHKYNPPLDRFNITYHLNIIACEGKYDENKKACSILPSRANLSGVLSTIGIHLLQNYLREYAALS
jgi:hypothetical protein